MIPNPRKIKIPIFQTSGAYATLDFGYQFYVFEFLNDSLRIIVRIPDGFLEDSLRILRGFLEDSLWIPEGFFVDSLRNL